MKFPAHLKYWLLPLIILTPLIAFYFSNLQWTTDIIIPENNRELGIVENIQLLILLLIFVVLIAGFFRKSIMIERICYLLLALFTVFVFLEEIDYGAHFMQYFKGHNETFFRELTGEKNVHNIGNRAKLFKRSIYPIMLLIFIIAPIFKDKFKHPVFQYLIPTRSIILTALITMLSYIIPRLIVEFGILEDGGFDVDIGEFSEIMIYYIFLLYIIEIVFKKQLSLR